jgi:hypothetical protein
MLLAVTGLMMLTGTFETLAIFLINTFPVLATLG